MKAQYTIDDKHGMRRAIVSVTDDGDVIVNHYRRSTPRPDSRWTLDRTCKPTAPFHVVLDDVTNILNRPPEIGERAR